VLRQVAEGVLVHQSQFCQSNATIVKGHSGVLLIDPGILDMEMVALADDLFKLGLPVVAGFSTHPHWDHLLWHPQFGSAIRYGTARCAATVRDRRVTEPDVKARISEQMIPPDISPQVPLDLLGLITGLTASTTLIPWDGPKVRIIEHQAHAAGHAALLIEEQKVLLAGDMLSDVLIPLLDMGASNPIDDYLAGLQLLQSIAAGVDVLIPGHGSVGGTKQLQDRLTQDLTYVQALRSARTVNDRRIGSLATYDWLADVHTRQLQQLAQKEASN
jgi:glyoxylase-like metal-dependent hydrolase (beta-lactamase superfamily II)